MKLRSMTSLLLACAMIVLSSISARAEGPTRIDGIGLIDYDHPPDFRVGSWVKYHFNANSETGLSEEYDLTLIIGGEEEFWGERCFWVETHIDPIAGSASITATLMSYDAFKDSLGLAKMQYYRRKSVAGRERSGKTITQVYRMPRTALQSGSAEGGLTVAWDTLGTDTVSVPKGQFPSSVYRFRQGMATNSDVGDSTIRETLQESRKVFMNPRVPVTHLVKEEGERLGTRQAWLIGQGLNPPPEAVKDRGRGTAVLVDYGEGMEATAVPEQFRKSLADQAKEARRAAAPPARRSKP